MLDTTRQTIEVYRDHQHFELSVELQERLHTAIMTRFREKHAKRMCGTEPVATSPTGQTESR